MAPMKRPRTWTVGDCTISCESRIFTFVMSEAAPEQPLRNERAGKIEPARPRRKRTKRGD